MHTWSKPEDDEHSNGVIIEPKTLSASKAERSEYKTVRGVFSSGQCIRESIYKSFVIDNPSGGKLGN